MPRWMAIVTACVRSDAPSFSQNILDVHLDGAAGGAELDGDLFVRQARAPQAEHLRFARRERHLREVFGEPLGDFVAASGRLPECTVRMARSTSVWTISFSR